MNLEALRIRLNVFRVQTRQHKISEQNIHCYIQIDGERVPINKVIFEKTKTSYDVIMEGNKNG